MPCRGTSTEPSSSERRTTPFDGKTGAVNQKRRRITIVGLGLIGGSLGLALRAANRGWEVVGHSRRHETTGRAKKLGAVDRAEWNLPRAVEDAEIVVLAVPPAATEKVLADVAPHLPNGCVVTDVGSTKAQVLEWADRILPAHVDFVGGHPMAGKETAGIEAADADLFRGAVYCILPGARCSPESVTKIEEVVRAIGARPYYLEPAEHDSYVAAISHLPFIAAAALVTTVTAGTTWRDMARLAAGGFRDTTRTASGDVAMHRDICLTNREAVGRWLDAYIAELHQARDMIVGADGPAASADAEGIERFFERAKATRDAWLRERSEGTTEPSGPAPPPLPGMRESITDMFLGRRERRQ